MKLEYDYRIGENGIEFSLIDDFDDQMDFNGTADQKLAVQRYIMLAWQEAINKTSDGPEEIRRLMSNAEGQAVLQNRAKDYLAELLEKFPSELDRRGSDRRDRRTAPRENSTDRRYARFPQEPATQ